jgi:hypothetical protein
MPRQIIMDPSGHSTIEFDADNTTDLAEAERRFNRLVAKGFIPAEARGIGEHHVPRENKRVFNPHAEETIFVPSLRGG